MSKLSSPPFSRPRHADKDSTKSNERMIMVNTPPMISHVLSEVFDGEEEGIVIAEFLRTGDARKLSPCGVIR